MKHCTTHLHAPLNDRRQWLVARLAQYGIKTMGDLDTWRNSQRWKDSAGEYIPSRHKALVAILDEDAAIEILNNLAILQCRFNVTHG